MVRGPGIHWPFRLSRGWVPLLSPWGWSPGLLEVAAGTSPLNQGTRGGRRPLLRGVTGPLTREHGCFPSSPGRPMLQQGLSSGFRESKVLWLLPVATLEARGGDDMP